MRVIRRNAKPAGVFLTILMLSITIPYQSVFAAMIGTEATLDSTQAQQARVNVKNLLSREDVQSALMAQGIDPLEAKARIDSLSDDEVIQIASEINELSANAGGMTITPPIGIVIAVIAAVVLIIVGIVYLATSD